MRSTKGNYPFPDDYNGNWTIFWTADKVDDGWMFGIDSVIYHGNEPSDGEVQYRMLPEQLAFPLLDQMTDTCIDLFARDYNTPWTNVRDCTRRKGVATKNFPTDRITTYEDEHGDLWLIDFEVSILGIPKITKVRRLGPAKDGLTPTNLTNAILEHVKTVASKRTT